MVKKILVVDDEKDLTETLALMLEANGYKVVKAYGGQEGLERAEKENPNLILLDIMMPGINGIETLFSLKSNPKTNYIPVIMLSCRGELSYLAKAKDLGSVDYFIKPFELKELLRTIKKYI